MSTTCVNRAIAPRPVPRPNSAVTIGRPIAISEPNVSSSTTIAASSPTAVESPKPTCSVASIAWPPSSTCRPGRAAARGDLTTRSAALLGSRLAFSLKTTVAKAIWPLAEIDLPAGGAGVGADHVGDVRQLGDLGEHRAHARPHGRVLHGARADLEDDRVAVAGLRGEALLQQVRGALGVGVGQREVVRVARAGRLGEGVDADQQHTQPSTTYLRCVVDQRASLSTSTPEVVGGRKRGGRGSRRRARSAQLRVGASVDARVQRHAGDQRVAAALAREHRAPQLLGELAEDVLGLGAVGIQSPCSSSASSCPSPQPA